MHGASSLWNRLKWLVDIRALLGGKSEEQIEALADRGRELGVERCVMLAFLLCHHVWGQPLPVRIIEQPRRDRALAMLFELSLKAMADPDPRMGSIGTTRLTLATFRLRDDLPFRRSALAAALIDADLVARTRLPRGLWYLYGIGRVWKWLGRRLG